MSLLLQLNGDMPEQFPGHERRLYIFGCKRKPCGRKEGSIRGIRGIRVAAGSSSQQKKPAAKTEENTAPKQPQINLGETLFGVAGPGASSKPANPFSTSSSGPNPFSTSSVVAPGNPFSGSSLAAKPPQQPTPTTQLAESFADKVRLNTPEPSSAPAKPHEPWPSNSDCPPPYPKYYLDAEYETLDADPAPVPQEANTTVDMEVDGGSGGNEKDLFESSMDKAFQKFADRVAQNAEQALRYEFKGQPLLYNKDDPVGKALGPHLQHNANAKVQTSRAGGSGMPRCQNCGGERVFEAQLMPQAIAELEAEEMGLEGMEWGTVILGTCAKDCADQSVKEGEVGYLEEWIGVQWEELAKR